MDVYFPTRMGLTSFDRTPNQRMQMKSFNISAQSKFQLGGLCQHDHSATDADGNKLDMSIRYRSGGNCVECARLTGKRSMYARRDEIGESEINKARARSRLEDMQIAKEIGLTLEEYYSE